jgi:hypothetical protein
MWSSAFLVHLAVAFLINGSGNAPRASAAHSLGTHAKITSAVVAHTVANGLECSDPAQARRVLDSLLQIGTIGEDDWTESKEQVRAQIKAVTGRDVNNEFLVSAAQSMILGRFNFHFWPKLDDVQATCSSLEWGFGNQPCTYTSLVPGFLTADWAAATGNHPSNVKVTLRNQFTWGAAVAQAQQPAGNTGFSQGFVSLGYVLHLLEDLTSPAHSRSDAHGPNDPDWIEYRMPNGFKEEFEKIKTLSILPENERTPVMPANRPLAAESIEPTQLFTEVHDYVRANFFSKSTVTLRAPGPVTSDGAATSCQSGSRGITWARYICDSKDRAIAKGNFPIERTPGVILQSKVITWPTEVWIDSWVADEQWKELGPVAVRAGSRLMMLYIRQAQPLMPCRVR